MRTIKAGLIIVVALGMLAGFAVAIAAQSGEEMPPVHVTGQVHFADSDPVGPPTTSTSDGVVREFRGITSVRQLTMSDPRLSGSQHAVWNQFDYGIDGSTVAGRLSIENDGGSWRGTYRGVIFPHGPAVARHQAVLVGEGEYEGLSAVLYYDPSGSEDALGVEGFIFRGEVPETPALE